MAKSQPGACPSNYTDEARIQPHREHNLSSSSLFGITIACVLAFVSVPAQAHTGTGLAGGFISGFLHPLTGWDHLLAMVSVGLWGAILGRPLIVALPVIFPSMMVVGAFLGILNFPMPPVEIGIAMSVLLLGGVIAFGYRAPVWLACVIVAVFALFHGHAHGKELPSAADPVGYSTGFVLSTGLLHVCGIVIGLINGHPKGRLVVKGLGAAIALAGCLFMTQAVI
jgi:urease accessory protein